MVDYCSHCVLLRRCPARSCVKASILRSDLPKVLCMCVCVCMRAWVCGGCVGVDVDVCGWLVFLYAHFLVKKNPRMCADIVAVRSSMCLDVDLGFTVLLTLRVWPVLLPTANIIAFIRGAGQGVTSRNPVIWTACEVRQRTFLSIAHVS